MNNEASGSAPDGGNKPDKSSGQTLPYFKRKGRPSILSTGDANSVVKAINKLLNLNVSILPAETDPSGNAFSTGRLIMAGLNAVLELKIASGDGSGGSGSAGIVAMQVQSYTTSNDYLSAKLGSFTGAGTFTATGSAINVALPWELRPAQKPGSTYTLFPVITAGDIIWALETDGGQNGVFVSAAELQYMDLALGRYWRARAMVDQGLWSTGTYNAGDVTYTNSGSSLGTWVCILNGTTSANPPTWPMPSATGGTDHWRLIAFAPYSDGVCDGGAKMQYMNALPPA